MKINNLLAFFSTFLISLTVESLLKKSLLKKTKLTNKNSEYSEDRAKSYSKYLMGASCAKKPLKKTCALCLKPADGNEFVHFYLSKRSKLPFKLLIQCNDTMQKIFLFFSGPIFNKSNIQYFSKHFLSGKHLNNVKQYQGNRINSEVYNVYFEKIKKKIYKSLERLIKSNRDEFGLVFVGNSIAGSLATFAAFDVKNNFEKAKNFKSYEVYAFNAFNFADDEFNKKLKASQIKFFRIFKENDFIISPNCSYNTANSKWKCNKVQDAALLQGDAAKDLNSTSTNSTLNSKNTTEAYNNNNTNLNKNNSSIPSNHTDKASNRSFRFDEDFLFLLEEKNGFELKDESAENDYFNSENDNNEEFLNEELISNELRNEEEDRMQAINNNITVVSDNNTAFANTNLTMNMKNSSNFNSTEVSKLVRNHVVNSNYSAPIAGKRINGTGIGNKVTQNGNTKVSNPKLVIKIDNKMRKNITIRINMNSTNGNRLGNKNNSMRKKGLLLNNTLISPNNSSAYNNYSRNNASANNNYNNNLNGNNTSKNSTWNFNNTSEINKTNHNSNFTKTNNTNNTNYNDNNDNSTHINNSSSNNHTSDSNNKTNYNNTDSANDRPHNNSNTEGNHKNNHTKNHKHSKNAHSHKKNHKHNHHKHNSHHNKNPNHKKIKDYEKTENLGGDANIDNSNSNLISSSKCYANSIKTEPGSVLLQVDPGAYGEIIVYNKQMNKFESCTPEESKENDCKKCLINLVLERSINSYSHLDLFAKKLDSCKHK